MEIPDFDDGLWPLLAQVAHPSRYAGCEWGPVKPKESGQSLVRFCLAFPDVYEIGMSYVGFQILYNLLKRLPKSDVERAYCPWIDMEELLRKNELYLGSIETGRPLSSFDGVGFTLQYELSFTNILTMLDLGGIPLYGEERTESDPIVFAGGPGTLTPEPVAPFIDVFCLGEGEVLLPQIVDILYETKGLSRKERLNSLAGIEGIYIPSLVDVKYGDGGTIFSSSSRLPVRRQLVKDFKDAFHPDNLIVPSAGVVHDRVPVEIFRGCTRGCRFCQAGIIYRPVRERGPEETSKIVRELVLSSGWEEVGLVSLASCDYSGLTPLLNDLTPFLDEKGVKLSLPSLRMDSFSIDLAASLQAMRRGGLTFAPEAGTQRLRNVINKGVTEEDIKISLETAFKHGWDRVKLYFMMGLPTETEEDLQGIIDIALQTLTLGKAYKRKVNVAVSVAGFVPKGHTPFQWEPQNTMEELREKGQFLKRQIYNRRISLKYHDPEQTFLEGVFARGDRRLAKTIECAWRKGARFDGWSETFSLQRWLDAFDETGIDPLFYTSRSRSKEEGFPWDHIDTGVSRAFLWKEKENAFKGELTPDCRWNSCHGCGWQNSGCQWSKGECSL
ncbi:MULTISPECIES: TIGR03960 family B12-binding radical SAM protein [Aminobacterium]|jgi:radical SAM family uncharacterized protein|uniref:TIGR03960 family B12-binding radical SAM protein n=1 Tax=Aminobacterium TaxID=81466 RepID=UPI00257DBCC6|nr:TIGR03960 family B12-binding radical SAM protein [Aminobacterium sp. UBA4987]